MNQNIIYRISANSFRGNYSFLNLTLFTMTFDLYFIKLNSCCGNYSREETIRENTVCYVNRVLLILLKILQSSIFFPQNMSINFENCIRAIYIKFSAHIVIRKYRWPTNFQKWKQNPAQFVIREIRWPHKFWQNLSRKPGRADCSFLLRDLTIY